MASATAEAFIKPEPLVDMTTRYFSIVMPAFNRASTIGRAIRSCLEQDFADFELIVSDDCSTDETRAVARSFADDRLRLVESARNTGPCPTRNRAVDVATGRWCVMVDSDFSLLPGALSMLHRLSLAAPADVGNVATQCRWDRPWPDGGTVTPLPGAANCVFDYENYLRWWDTLIVPEYFNCIRRDVFREIRFPDSRAWEISFHFALARRWRFQILPDTLVMVHTDATNRLTTSSDAAATARVMAEGPDKLANYETIWRDHLDALQRHAPQKYQAMLLDCGKNAMISGQRQIGVSRLLQYLARRPLNLRAWAMLLTGLVGPRAVVTAWRLWR